MKEDNREPRVIESASATTSRDNENSGPFAYVITAVALGLLLLVGVAGAGCVSLVLSSIADDYQHDMQSTGATAVPNDDFDFDFDEDFDFDTDLEEFIERYANPNGSHHNTSNSSDKPSSDAENAASVADALDFSIAPYGDGIEAGVSASAYAGVSDAARDFVRSVVTTDTSNNKQLVVYLDNAAKNENERAQNIASARELCKAARSAMEALQAPSSDEVGGDAAEKLSVALGKAQERWSLMEEEISLLDTSDKVDTEELWKRDEKVLQATEDAANQLEEALYAAANK